MHRAKTDIGAWAARKAAFPMLFCVTALSLTGSGGPQRSLGVQMAWELKIAREEGLIAAIESLAARNPGQWDKRTNTIVSRWLSPDGISIKSTFEVPSRKIIKVTQGSVPLLYIDSKLDNNGQSSTRDRTWYLPGKWTQAILALAAAEPAAQPKAGVALSEAADPAATAPAKNYG